VLRESTHWKAGIKEWPNSTFSLERKKLKIGVGKAGLDFP
jgi:hypothetical protein